MVVVYSTKPYKPMKVRCDASISKDGVASLGMVFLNHNGRMLDRFGKRYGVDFKHGEIEDVELAAMRKAVEMLSNEGGVDHVKVYCDCKDALARVQAIRDEFGDDFDYLTFEYIPRHCNTQADLEADRHIGRIGKGEVTNELKYGMTD